MATLQNLGVLKYRDKDGNWKPLPVVLQSSGGGGSGGISTISGNGQPTESTVGRLNQLYRDESTDKLYICTGVEGGYTWAAVVSDTEDAVTYTAQTLTEEQKTQARANIGAGTSNFSGSYNDLTNKPNIPAASVIDTTLSKSGQAADAKAAGDAIAQKLDATALPTAINDALAQAKASGEFDGAKGADGKDGAGMDVTGANVGQIAKITAVDSAGKPTAWEAVDMPSGGGGGDEWELIADVTISEPVNSIIEDVPSGKNELLLFARGKWGTEPSNKRVGFKMNGLWYSSAYKIDSAWRYFKMHIMRLPQGYVWFEQQHNNMPTGGQADLGIETMHMPGGIYEPFKMLPNGISNVSFSMIEADGTLNTGFQFMVFGR